MLTHRLYRFIYQAFLVAGQFVIASINVLAEQQPPLYGQVHFGYLHLDDQTVEITAGDDRYQGELSDKLPYLGASA